MSRPDKKTLMILILLAVLVVAVFGQGIDHQFTNLDDNRYISDNPELDRGLTWSGLGWAFNNREANLWMPVTWLSFLADYQFFGLKPGAYHLTNILLHLMNTLLLFLVLRRWTGSIVRAGFVAALFAVHPLHVESVSWVAERKDVLSGFFFLMALWFYQGYRRSSAPLNYLAAFFSFALSLMAKPMVVTLPVVLLLMDFFGSSTRQPIRRLLLDKIPFLALSAALSVITYLLVQTRNIGAPDPIPLGERLGQAVVFYTLYLGKMFWPTNLSVFYPPESLHFSSLQIFMSAMLMAVITFAAWRVRKNLGLVLMGWLWYLVMLLPVAGVIQGGMQLMSDRYFYLPSIGLFMAVVWAINRGTEILLATQPLLRRLVPLIGGAVVLVAAVTAFGQARVWQDSETLFSHALAVNEDNYLAHASLGVELDGLGRSAEALPHLVRAVELRKDALYQYNLAVVFSHLERHAEAIPYYRGAVRLQPDYPTAHNNLAISLVYTGDWDGAGEHFRIAVEQDPEFAGAYYNLGLVQVRGGLLAEAKENFRRTLVLDPDHQDAREQLGLLERQK